MRVCGLDRCMSRYSWMKKQMGDAEEQNRHPLPPKNPEEGGISTCHQKPEAMGARDEHLGRCGLLLGQEALPVSRAVQGLISPSFSQGRSEEPTHQLVKLTAAFYKMRWRDRHTAQNLRPAHWQLVGLMHPACRSGPGVSSRVGLDSRLLGRVWAALTAGDAGR